jgi:hypothetical protein
MVYDGELDVRAQVPAVDQVSEAATLKIRGQE